MLELSEDYNISMSKILTEVTSGDSLYCRHFLYSALSVLNPLDLELESKLPECKQWVAKNDPKFEGMSDKDIAINDIDVTITAIERFYELNPDKVKFEISYESFVNTWGKEGGKKENYKKALAKAAESSKLMGFGRTSKLSKENKIVKVTTSMAVFRSIQIIGLNKIVIKLNPDFMPYLVLLNQIFIESGYKSFPVRALSGKRSVSSLIMSAFALRIFRSGKGVSQTFDFDIGTLRHLLGCEKKYPIYKDFRKNILIKGITGINEDKAGGFTMEIISEEKQNGRSVSSVKFQITSELLNSKKKMSDKQKYHIENKIKQAKGPNVAETKSVAVSDSSKKASSTVAARNAQNEAINKMKSMIGKKVVTKK